MLNKEPNVEVSDTTKA